MRFHRVLARAVGVGQAVVESVRADASGMVIVVRPHARAASRCGVCRRVCPGFDQGRGEVRRWRVLDVGVLRCYAEAAVVRVSCPRHGVVVESVPWARHRAGHARVFDQQVAWLATRKSKTAVVQLMRISWATVGAIIARVTADADAVAGDRLDGLTRIGVDEVSYKRHHKYLTVVVDHHTRRVVWLAEGRSKATLAGFFELLGPDRCGQIDLVSADGADWIFHAVQDHCPRAKICLDPFHVVAWAVRAVDDVRRRVWNQLRRAGDKAMAKLVKDARFAVWKNPENLTDRQQVRLADIAEVNKPLYRAYLLKEHLREVFAKRGQDGALLLRSWLRWAARSKVEEFVDLARRIRLYFQPDILNTLHHGLSNGLIESTNTKIRLLTRMAFGFKSADALIALAKLHLGGYQIELPGRS
ncbi:MAG: ISL3 family transposase [Hamadaea sp.]|nr:ISL3 family transposase [Hamadaea sp.]